MKHYRIFNKKYHQESAAWNCQLKINWGVGGGVGGGGGQRGEVGEVG